VNQRQPTRPGGGDKITEKHRRRRNARRRVLVVRLDPERFEKGSVVERGGQLVPPQPGMAVNRAEPPAELAHVVVFEPPGEQ
jgi:hypothetical protein